jgi:Spy/CpxP family protein refolding chaperone
MNAPKDDRRMNMTDEKVPAGKRFGYLALILAITLSFVGGGLAVAGVAMHHLHHMGWGGHHGMRDQMNPGEQQEHIQRMVGMLSWKVDATTEQKQKLTAIAAAAVKELEPYHQKFFDAHKRAHELLLQPTMDRAALEALRAEQIASADEASKKLVQFLADASDVLTLEQRAKLAKGWDF